MLDWERQEQQARAELCSYYYYAGYAAAKYDIIFTTKESFFKAAATTTTSICMLRDERALVSFTVLYNNSKIINFVSFVL